MAQPSFSLIAIDGGAATGKSSTAKEIARRRHYLHVDTGAHYRAITAAALAAGVPPEEGPELDAFLKDLRLETVIDGRDALISLNGCVPAKAHIRSDAVNAHVSLFAAIPAVRTFVKNYQRAQAEVARRGGFHGLIMDGRDIGTVIFPEADLKIYLVADPDTRANRRALEGQRDTIVERDKRDAGRTLAPMQAADDAVILDNSEIDLPAVVEHLIGLLDARGLR